MIITKTPFRLSFFGGGTDYPEHYLEHGGAVLGTSINKYCYITCRNLPPFFDHKYRIAYSVIENAKSISEIKHPAVKGVLNYLKINTGLEIHHDGDLPARSGLGSSSSFTAGLLNAIYALNGKSVSKFNLAMETIHVEQNLIHEKVGSQDQVLVSMGGLRIVRFNQDAKISSTPVIITSERKKSLADHLLLFFTGITRDSQKITEKHDIAGKRNDLIEMHKMVDQGAKILNTQERDITDFGRLMHESWLIKRGISENISSEFIDGLYQKALDNGAVGGKLLGAGGGGFLAIFAKPEKHKGIRTALSNLVHVPFSFDTDGSTVCVNEPQGF
jgi:D-glycero-alpha-D-manno-heptose-7-phosphate kinase